MVFIGTAQQARLFDAARRHLGSGGDATFKEVARTAFDLPMDQLTYAHLMTLLKNLEGSSAATLGRQPAFALAAAIRQLGGAPDTGLGDRLIAAIAKRLGPAAEPFIETVCKRQGLLIATLDKNDLVPLAQAVKQDAALLLGEDAASSLAAAVLECGTGHNPDLAPKCIALATEHLGPDGEAMVRSVCRNRLEVELEELSTETLDLLARIVEEEMPARIGAARAAAFVDAAKQSISSPATELREKILLFARRAVGPVGEQFVQQTCAKNGLPFRAVDYEHLMWLAEILRGEGTPLLGKQKADDLAREVRGLLTGGR
jgi:hypothetical protein